MSDTKSPRTLEKLRPSRNKRDVMSFSLILIISISTITFISIQDENNVIRYSSDIPTINVVIEDEISNVSQQCFVKVSTNSKEYSGESWINHLLPANIRIRNSDGGYSFELFRGENLLSMRNDDDWILIPSGPNLGAIRSKLSSDFFNQMNLFDQTYTLPDSKFVDLYINNEYQDLYLLSERVDRQSLNLADANEENPEDNDKLFKISSWDGDFYTIPDNIQCSWEILYPNHLSSSELPQELVNFVLNSTEDAFFNENTGIFSKFEKKSLINNLLFSLLSGHETIEGSACYFVYDKITKKFSILPRNFDQSWGFNRYGTIPSDIWLNKEKNGITSIVWSHLYKRLLFPENLEVKNNIKSEIVNQWSKTRNTVWDSTNLINSVDKMYNKVQDTLNYHSLKPELITNKISHLDDWISTRMNTLDEIFQNNNDFFINNLKNNFPENETRFGFSSSTARRYFHKSSILFSKEEIHEIDIIIQQKYASDMVQRRDDEDRNTEQFYMPSDISIDGYSMSDVGCRIRGNFLQYYPKNSFKFKFSETNLYLGNNTYRNEPSYENRRFLGLKRLNIRSGFNDLSKMNEIVGYELFKMTGLPSIRISWTKLYIKIVDDNGEVYKEREYKGLYWISEDLDKTFLSYNFKNHNANLYKTTYVTEATLHDPESFRQYYLDRTGWDIGYMDSLKDIFPEYTNMGRVYELRTNEELDDYSDLDHFVDNINHDWNNINSTADLDAIAKYFAASHFQGSWDDYCGIPHNFFLYSNPNSGFLLLPWDIENNLNTGSNQSINSWNQRDYRYAPLLEGYKEYYDWVAWRWSYYGEERPLWDNAINDSYFVEKYLGYMGNIAENIPILIDQVNIWFDFIEDTLLSSYNYTFAPFYGVYTVSEYKPHFLNEKARVLNYLEGRKEYVEEQLEILQ